jgi:DNA-binding LytR/AlgR family response regulator
MRARRVAVVAEDERVLRDEICRHLGALRPDVVVAAAVGDGASAMRAIDAHAPDMLVLDVEMPAATGLEVARYASGRCHVVFVTAYDEFAVAAFDEGAADYVMKPINAERMALALARLDERMASTPPDLAWLIDRVRRARVAASPFLRWVNVAKGDEVRLVTVDDIRYFQSDLKYTRVITGDGAWLIRRSVRELVGALDPSMFRQIHRSIVVNLGEVAAVTRDLRGRHVVRLKGGDERLPVSEPYAHLFRQM